MPVLESRFFHEAYFRHRLGNHGRFSPIDEMVLFDYRVSVREELQRRPERFWVSPDIASAVNVVLEPENPTFVPIFIPYSMKPFTDFHPYAFSCADASTRSRFALAGAEVSSDAGRSIAETIVPIDNSDLSKGYKAIVLVENQAARSIQLSEGTKFFYLYYWDGSTIHGKDLKDLVGSRIKVSGDENTHFKFWYGPEPTGKDKDIKGIEFFLDPQSRSWIPPHPKPVIIDDGPAENHNRSAVDEYLVKPIPQTSDRQILWIAQTMSDIEFDFSINGLVDMSVSYGGLPIGKGEKYVFQTNSVLIRGGNTYGRTRSEIKSLTEEHLIPKTILMRFAWA